MFSEKSLRVKYVLQLASASMMLILILSSFLYHYIKITIFENAVADLKNEVEILKKIPNLEAGKLSQALNSNSPIQIVIKNNEINQIKPKFIKGKSENSTFLTLEYPIKDKIAILKTETTIYTKIVSQILIDILLINFAMIFLIIFYAMFLSRTLLMPIKMLNNKISRLNEKFLKQIDEKEIADEFLPLAKSLNKLISRIQTFVLYQKELFVGVAHELKTPLAVMKTKNEVTLIKQRDAEKYIQTLKQNITEINTMNKMISSILEIGRQEGAQFENPQKIEMMQYLKGLGTNFEILAKQNKKNIVLDLEPKELFMTIQPTLFLHILQNFVQNAIKFSFENSEILIKSYIKDKNFIVEVIDCGIGIDENLDLFAPFKRYGDKSGAGLGLFLAKGASEAMGAKISIKNRTDQKGAIATILMPL